MIGKDLAKYIDDIGLDVDKDLTPLELRREVQTMYNILMFKIQQEINENGGK